MFYHIFCTFAKEKVPSSLGAFFAPKTQLAASDADDSMNGNRSRLDDSMSGNRVNPQDNQDKYFDNLQENVEDEANFENDEEEAFVRVEMPRDMKKAVWKCLSPFFRGT